MLNVIQNTKNLFIFIKLKASIKKKKKKPRQNKILKTKLFSIIFKCILYFFNFFPKKKNRNFSGG